MSLTRRRRTHDAGAHWMAFIGRMSRLHEVEEIARELAAGAAQTADASAAAVYLMDADESAYRLTASVGGAHFRPSLEPTTAVPTWLRWKATSTPLPAELLSSLTTPALAAAIGVSIRWRTTLLGFIVLAPRRFAAGQDAEEGEFLTMVAEHTAAALMAARLSAAAADPRRIETLDRCTAAVVHDLKNSVSALSLLARNAPSNFADPEFQREAIVTLSRTVERMRRLLVKLASPDVRAARTEPIDLQELIIEATTPLVTDTKVRLVRQLAPVNTLYGDRDALLRVVENLATNAAEAIDREGTVTVTLTEEQGNAVISVADTGCGIPEEYQERHLFSPFRSTKKDGWGIGLYQTKQVVETQYGEILVESMEGHGTTFTVKLPLRADAESPSLETVR